MKWTPHWSPWASSDKVSCSFSYHTWQFIIFTFSTITACIFSYSLRISFWTQDLALPQILSSIDLFLFYRTDYTDSRTMLNDCTGKCVRLSRPLVGFWTQFKSPHFHFISFNVPPNTYIGHNGDEFLRVKWLYQQCQSTSILNAQLYSTLHIETTKLPQSPSSSSSSS